MKPRKPFPDEQAKLDALHAKFSAGHGIALFEAMELCWLRGWHIPGWVSNAIVEGLALYRRGAVRDLGDAFNLPKQSVKRAHWATLMPVAGGTLCMPISEYVLKHVPVKPYLVEMWKPLAAAIANNFRSIGWPAPGRMSARTLQRMWEETLPKKKTK